MTAPYLSEIQIKNLEETSKLDDATNRLVPSDLRCMLAEIRRLQEYEWMYKDLCK